MQVDLGEQLDKEMEIERAGEVTFARLHALVKRGYIAELGTDSGAVWLNHPSKRFRYATLILFASGKIASTPSESPELHIYGGEETEFAAFLRTVPTPSVWDRTRAARTQVAVWLFFIALWAVAWWFSEAVKSALGW